MRLTSGELGIFASFTRKYAGWHLNDGCLRTDVACGKHNTLAWPAHKIRERLKIHKLGFAFATRREKVRNIKWQVRRGNENIM